LEIFSCQKQVIYSVRETETCAAEFYYHTFALWGIVLESLTYGHGLVVFGATVKVTYAGC
jgi:hypothetical protein